MARLDTGIAQQNPQHFGKDMHVTAERHRREEKAQTDGIRPPYRHEIQIVTENPMPERIDRNRQETAAAEVGRETLGQKSERENQPEAIQSYTVSQ